MKRKFIYLVVSTVLAGGASWALPSQATEFSALPPRTVPHFSDNGKIDRIDLNQGVIVIRGTTFRLSSDVHIYASNGSSVATNRLVKGANIGFNVLRQQESGVRVVTEILIKPAP